MIPFDPPGASDAPAIAVAGLSKRFGKVRAVRNLTFHVQRGQVFGFLGLNGAGKTTTIRILLDLLRPTAGTARVFDLDCQRDSRRTRTLVGFLPGELGLYGDLTGTETLDLLGRLSPQPVRNEYRRQLLDRLELAQADLQRRLREFSTGMKRKLGIVQALQADPPLLILDEPTEGLDPLVQHAFNGLLSDLRARGRTVLMSSHVLSEVERVCDRIAVIREGSLVMESTVEEARRLGGRLLRIAFREPVAALVLPDGMVYEAAEPTRWRIRAAGDLGVLLPALGSLPVRDLEIVEPSLEEVLRRFYREGPP